MIKTNSITQIQYTLITSESSFSESSFYNKVSRILKEFPKDLLQLENTVDHFDFSFRFCLRKGLELFSLSDSLLNTDANRAAAFFEGYSNEFNNALVKVFIIDSQIKSHENIAKFIEKITPSYFTIINDTDNVISNYNSKNYFSDGSSLLELINRDREIITKKINEHYPDIEIKLWSINPNKSYVHENELVFSNLTEANYFILNQIIGNFWIDDYKKYNNDNLEELRILPEQRVKQILSKAQTIDGFTNVMHSEKDSKQVSPFNPLYPTLILIAPFHFPGLNKLLRSKKLSKKEKTVLKVHKTEQRLDYCFEVDP